MDSWQEADRDVIDMLNVGIAPRLRNGETFEGAMDTAFALASARQRSRRREPNPFDLATAAAALCWNPFKPRPGLGYVELASRARLVFYRADVRDFYAVDTVPLGQFGGLDQSARPLSPANAEEAAYLYLGDSIGPTADVSLIPQAYMNLSTDGLMRFMADVRWGRPIL